MKDHEFYQQYANLPTQKRGEFLGYAFRDLDGGHLTPKMIYEEIKKIDDKIRGDVIRKGQLLKIAERYFICLR